MTHLPALLASTQNAVLVYFLAVNGLYVLLFLISLSAILDYLRRLSYRNAAEILKAKVTPPISMIVPAFNEEKGIVTSVSALLRVDYPEFEVVVVNDGSTDQTLDALIRRFDLRLTRRIYHKILPTGDVHGIYVSRDPAFAALVVVDKANGGKADALNAGINASRYPLFCALDADSLLEKDSLLRVCLPFLEQYHETTAVGGIVRIANGCRIFNGVVEEVGLSDRWLPTFQVVEYLRAFLSGRMGWSQINALLVVSGAFGIFKRSDVLDVGGFSRTTVGEDMELVLRLHHRKRSGDRSYRIRFIPDPVCWTEAPEKLRSLWNQRDRWQRGLGQSLARHAGMLLNPRYGAVGLVALPYFWAVELLSPLLESAGYALVFASWWLGRLDVAATGALLLLTVVMGILLSIFAVLLEEITMHRYPKVRNVLRLFLASVFENLGYRQLTLLARLFGMIGLVSGRAGWGRMERRGVLGSTVGS